MAQSRFVHVAVDPRLAEEINRVMLDCEKMNLVLTKKEATALIGEKSKRGFMPKQDIIKFLTNSRYRKK